MALPSTWRGDVEQMIAEMYFLVDSGRADETPRYVTDDFVFALGPNELDRAGYEAAMEQRAAATHLSRHCATNLRITEQTDTSVTVSYITAAHRREEGDTEHHTMVGDTEDTWVFANSEWKLRRRAMSLAFPPAAAG